MATLIHILNKNGRRLTIAAYYPIPDNIYDASSADDARTAASDRLTTDELNAIKLGRLYEYIVDLDVMGKAEAEVKTFLVSKYEQARNNVLAKYVAAYTGYVDQAWDGQDWL